MKKALLIANTSWYIYNFRSNIIKQLQQEGFKVFVLAPKDEYSKHFKNCEFINIKIDRKGKNIFYDFLLCFEIYKKVSKIKPDFILSFTIKPNIYTSFVSKILKIPLIPSINGLGTVFINEGFFTLLVKFLYKLAFKNLNVVMFENKDDKNLFIQHKIIKKEQAKVVNGCGVDVDFFNSTYKEEGILSFIFIARFLKDKGIIEYINACSMLSEEIKAKFFLVGDIDEENKTSISSEELENFKKLEYLNFIPFSKDIKNILEDKNIVVLPSYREGLPKSLLEASAMSKPLIATNVQGCREIARKENAILCEAKNTQSLKKAMLEMYNLSKEKRLLMAEASRVLAVEEFSDTVVVKSYMQEIYAILSKKDN